MNYPAVRRALAKLAAELRHAAAGSSSGSWPSGSVPGSPRSGQSPAGGFGCPRRRRTHQRPSGDGLKAILAG
jgi:hypothetical protein